MKEETATNTRKTVAWTWSLPVELAANGSSIRESARTVVETARLILDVVPGERPLLPEFGWRGHLLPDPGSSVGRALAEVFAEEDLSRWAPELGVDRVEVARLDGETVGLLLLKGGVAHPVEVRCRRSAAEIARLDGENVRGGSG